MNILSDFISSSSRDSSPLLLFASEIRTDLMEPS